MNTLELKRQTIHFGGIFFSFLSLYFPTRYIGVLCFVWVFLLIYLAIKIKHSPNEGFIVKITHGILTKFERKDAFPFEGVMMFLTGIGLVSLIFPKQAAVAIAVLSVGDSISTIFGIHYGSHKLHFNKTKSYEGLIAGFVFAVFFSSYFTDFNTAMLASAVGMIVEALPIPVNDNISMPLSVGALLYIL